MKKRSRRETLGLCVAILESWGEDVTLNGIRFIWSAVRDRRLGLSDLGPFGGVA